MASLPEPHPRNRRFPLILVGGLLLLAAGVLFVFDPAQHSFYPFCVFHRATGWLCPGCGSLRALHQLVHGNLALAFRFNPLLILSLPLCLWFGLTRVQRGPSRPKPAFATRPWWVWSFLALLLIFGVLRNLPGNTFALLRPY